MDAVSQKWSLSDLLIRLYDVNGLKFGDFTMRTGEISPVYVDMRVIWSYPDIVKAVCGQIWKIVQGLKCQHLCGIPYQGIPLATYLSTSHDIPMLMTRKAHKTYGTGCLVEGHYKAKDVVLLLDDVLMTGGTVLEQVPLLKCEGLVVSDCVVFLDRDQGGVQRIHNEVNVNMHSVVTLPQAFDILLKAERMTQPTIDKILQYLKDNQFNSP